MKKQPWIAFGRVWVILVINRLILSPPCYAKKYPDLRGAVCLLAKGRKRAIAMNASDYSIEQLKFLELFEIAARYDCLYLLDFHCFALFEHDQTSLLTDEQRAELAETAQADIFAEAVEKGFRPNAATLGVMNGQRFLC